MPLVQKVPANTIIMGEQYVNRVIFLDIDGVLNDHSFDEVAGSSTFDREKVRLLNRIINETGAKIVLSSAWRYMISGGELTRSGFAYMMRTHGLDRNAEIVDRTSLDGRGRGHQIAQYVRRRRLSQFVILDDLDLLNADHGLPLHMASRFVRTTGTIGLTPELAEEAIRALNDSTPLPTENGT